MGRYRLTRKADADLANLYRYGLQNFGVARADKYFDTLTARLEHIADDPLLFPNSEYREGYRRSVHPPHTIYYRIVEPGLVEIVRILRGQDPKEAL